LMLSTILLFGALGQGQTTGYHSPMIISAFVISAITFVLFILFESKNEAPLLQLGIFKNSLFSVGISCAFISFGVISASNIILPFYFQDTLKFSPAVTGLFLMASPIVVTVVAPFSGYLSDKIGSEILTLIGLAFTGLGLFLISSLHESSSVVLLILDIVIMAFGNGMFQSPNNSIVMSNVAKDKLGIAGSVNALVRNLGYALGTSLSMVLLYNRMSYKAGRRVTDYIRNRNDIFMYGMKWVYMAAGTFCLIGVVITAVRFLSRKREKAEITKESQIV
jgi:MFS family permease